MPVTAIRDAGLAVAGALLEVTAMLP